MSALANAVTRESNGRRKPCSVGTALTVLGSTDPESRDHFQAWLDGEDSPLTGYTDREVHNALQTVGVQGVSKQQIGRHRRAECSCFDGGAA